MHIIGHGIDIVETARIRNAIDQSRTEGEWDGSFETACFTLAERDAAGSGARRIETLAGRFAAKEAVLKALGTGWSGGISWVEIEVRRLPSGKPAVILSGRCLEIAVELGVARWELSISHSASYATASAIAIGSEGMQ